MVKRARIQFPVPTWQLGIQLNTNAHKIQIDCKIKFPVAEGDIELMDLYLSMGLAGTVPCQL